MIAVQKNIPFPKKEKKPKMPRKKRESKYPFTKMEIGDSFLLPKDIPFMAARQAISRRARMNPGEKYKSKKTIEGRRVWRMS